MIKRKWLDDAYVVRCLKNYKFTQINGKVPLSSIRRVMYNSSLDMTDMDTDRRLFLLKLIL